MSQTLSSIRVGIGRDRFDQGTHACLVFRDEAERRKIVSKFVESGIVDGERVFYFADSAGLGDVVAWLRALDVDVAPYKESEDFTIDGAAETYCPDGRFDPDRMCSKLKTAYTSSRQQGYPASRVTGEMSWALRGMPGSDRLIEYEAAINTVVETHPITAMCQYDANRFPGETIFQALQVHPYMVMNGQLVKNPYYRART